MNFKARLITESDYDNILKVWWKDWRWQAPPKDFLPLDFNGIIVSNEDFDICACFIYNTNSQVSWLEFIISNFDVKDRELRKAALKFMIETVKNSLQSKYIYTSMRNQPLINSMKDLGFVEGSKDCTELIYIR
jgi:SAM-dependent MidA family methyltransferase